MTVVDQAISGRFALYLGDCVEVMRSFPAESIDVAIYSPPYSSLYVYSSSPRDMGNVADDDEFFEGYGYAIDETLRLLKPGRISAVDCMNLTTSKQNDGHIGLRDFRGEIIRQHVERGFIFHSEHCMWRDPLVAAVRTKALGLLHKQLCKDSSMSRAGIPQYLLAFRKPGENAVPIPHKDGLEYFVGEDPPTTGNLAHERWRRYASPVWMDIDFSRTLQYTSVREAKDEKHLCPMPLDITERALQLWSNEGETVLSPFAGIGSEGVVAIEMGRRFVGAELKDSYYRQARANLEAATPEGKAQLSLLDLAAAETTGGFDSMDAAFAAAAEDA